MAPHPNDRRSRDETAASCGCAVLLIVLILAVGYRVFIYRGDDEMPVPQVAPTSTTRAPDEAARLGCWSWRHAEDDGPYFSTEELPARMDWALQRAAESSVGDVARAARELQRASEYGTIAEHDAAWDAFKRACATVGE
jgi:hypothetical protein